MTSERRRECAVIGVCLAVVWSGSAAWTAPPEPQTAPPAAAASASASRTTAGELIVEPSTVTAIGFEWRIQGDSNHTAQAALSYRRVGETAWKTGLPLLRIQQEPIEPPARGGGPGEGGGGSPFRFVPPNMFALWRPANALIGELSTQSPQR